METDFNDFGLRNNNVNSKLTLIPVVSLSNLLIKQFLFAVMTIG